MLMESNTGLYFWMYWYTVLLPISEGGTYDIAEGISRICLNQ